MAHHLSAQKRIRQDEEKRVSNKYHARGMRNALKELRGTTDKVAAAELLPKVTAMLDKLAKTNIIHKNKAGNLKSKIQKHVSGL